MSQGKGNYLSDGRPNRHKVIQKWMEDKQNTRSSKEEKARTKLASLTQDSCFWAHVEEALKDLETLKQNQQQKLKSLEMFEGYVIRMINHRNISSDVFLEGSSFMEWWKEWKDYQQNKFPECLCDNNDQQSQHFFRCFLRRKQLYGVVERMERVPAK